MVKRLQASIISPKIKPYKGVLTRQDKSAIELALIAYSNDTGGEAWDFEQEYGLSPSKFIAQNYDKLLAYASNKKSLILYRALHFRTKAKLNKFIDSLERGILVEKKITSWTTDKSVAMMFFTKLGLVHEVVGCLLAQQVKPGEVVKVPVNKRMRYAEDEYILPPGKMKVELIDYSVTEELNLTNKLTKWNSYAKELKKRYR